MHPVELYLKEAKVPDKKKGQELVSLLEDEAFRIVSQMGFLCDDAIDYTAVKKCLEKQFAPPGVELEWQRKLHMAQQKSAESLTEFAAQLRMLADRAFPSWQPEDRLEMARNQWCSFIHHTAETVARAAADIGRCYHSGHPVRGGRIGTTKPSGHEADRWCVGRCVISEYPWRV